MLLLLLSLVVLCLGGLAALLTSRRPSLSSLLGAGSAVVAGILGIVPAIFVLITHQTARFDIAWNVPYGAFALGIDALSAIFVLALCVLGSLCAVYGASYMLSHHENKSLGAPWFFFNLMMGSILLVFTARNGMLFLMAWEGMAITSFFLVTFNHELKQVRDAGWTYLIVTHIGTAFLLTFFALALHQAGSLDFDAFSSLATGPTTALFLLALLGFGAKAGMVPLHVWLPEAHPAAPSHVSALMSGVMIKTGIYGILRMLTFLGAPPAWWGFVLIGVGLTSGILGVLFALAQHDLKRLLAYHSVENIGIITLGMGIGVWGLSQGLPVVALLGFAGAILHVVNHALFKGLLFLGAGSVLHATGNGHMDRQGGLLKRMPVTGATFLIGAAAISGLPPLNGFVSEFLILLGSSQAIVPATDVVPPLLTIVGLGAIGGLAVACFTKAFGIVFLGMPRSEEAARARRSPVSMQAAMIALAAGCIAVGLAAPIAVRAVLPAAAQMSGVSLEMATALIASSFAPLTNVALVALLVGGLMVALALARGELLRRRTVATAVTWDCGYERPSVRMQYTSSSFAQPLIRVFQGVLQTREHSPVAEGYFPRSASLQSETLDLFSRFLYQPLLEFIERVSTRLRMIQHGRVHLYLLYIFVTLAALLIWGLGLQS